MRIGLVRVWSSLQVVVLLFFRICIESLNDSFNNDVKPKFVLSMPMATIMETTTDELWDLLVSFKLTELHGLMYKHQITFNRLKMITEPDLKEIFQDVPCGLKIDFRYQLNNWRRENNFGEMLTAEEGLKRVITNILKSQETSQLGSFSNAQAPVVPPAVVREPFPTGSQELDIVENLKTFPNGEFVLQYANNSKVLTDLARTVLIDSIIQYYSVRKMHVSRKQFLTISMNIEQIFNDNRCIYYDPPKSRGVNPKGILYEKYYNNRKRNKKLGAFLNDVSDDHGEEDITDADPLALNNIEDSPELNEAYEWMRENVFPRDVFFKKWNLTFKLRQLDMKRFGIGEFMEKWNMLQQSFGTQLIPLDFDIMHPHCSIHSFHAKWESFKKKIKPRIEHKLKDSKQSDQDFQSDYENDHLENIWYLKHIHALLPAHIIWVPCGDGKRKSIRVTIKDSQRVLLLEVDTKENIKPNLDSLAAYLYEQNEMFQHPILIYAKNEKSFYVHFADIFYTFDSFDQAFDFYFKIFWVFGLDYPPWCNNVLLLIQNFIYEIEFSGKEKIPSKLYSLLQEINYSGPGAK